MSKIIDYLHELDLISLEKIEHYFLENDIDTIISFDEYIGDLAFEDWSIAEYSPYAFAPSMDVTGFGGCAEISCKIRRASKFIKFSSLYSDCIYLIVSSITNPHPIDPSEAGEEFYRSELIRDYSLILLYADLIQAGIARIIPAHFSVCPDCFSKYVCNISDFKVFDSLIEEYASRATMIATDYLGNHNISFVQLSNLPELFPDHDGYFALQGGIISELCKKTATFPHIITDKDYVHDFIKQHLFEQYLTTKFEAFISSSYQAKYITAKDSDKVLIESTNSKTIGNSSPPIFEMPFLENIHPKAILELRHSEQDAFNEYRIAIDQASKLYLTSSSGMESRDIYDDIIYPAFIKLDAMFNRAKRNHLIKNLCELAIVSSSVTLGVLSSAIPKDPMAIAAAAGGSELLLSQLGNVIEKKLSTGNELEQQDFYFLWKLSKK